MSDKHHDSDAKEGLVTFALSFAFWLGMLALFLGVGHLLAVSMAASHH